MYYVDIENRTGQTVKTVGPYESEQKAAHDAAEWRRKNYRADIRHEPSRRAPRTRLTVAQIVTIALALLAIFALATIGGLQ